MLRFFLLFSKKKTRFFSSIICSFFFFLRIKKLQVIYFFRKSPNIMSISCLVFYFISNITLFFPEHFFRFLFWIWVCTLCCANYFFEHQKNNLLILYTIFFYRIFIRNYTLFLYNPKSTFMIFKKKNFCNYFFETSIFFFL